jgi:hypothetical protein
MSNSGAKISFPLLFSTRLVLCKRLTKAVDLLATNKQSVGFIRDQYSYLNRARGLVRRLRVLLEISEEFHWYP